MWYDGGMTDTLDDQQITDALASLDGWAHDGDRIARTFSFDGYPGAVAFTVRVAMEAEAANHHPDLTLTWGKVHVALSSHDAGGITQRDVDLATTIQQLG